MTRKDFELIARTVRDMTLVNCDTHDKLESARFHRENIARRFAWSLSQANPAFDRARFLTACGVQS